MLLQLYVEMKTLTLILLLLSLPCSRPAVQVINATSVRNVPGRKESPVTVRYDIRVVTGKSSDILAFTKIYSKGRALRMRILSWPDKRPAKEFAKGDTLLLRAVRMEPEDVRDKQQAAPPHLTGEIVIEYNVRKKKHHLPVKDIIRMPEKINL